MGDKYFSLIKSRWLLSCETVFCSNNIWVFCVSEECESCVEREMRHHQHGFSNMGRSEKLEEAHVLINLSGISWSCEAAHSAPSSDSAVQQSQSTHHSLKQLSLVSSPPAPTPAPEERVLCQVFKYNPSFQISRVAGCLKSSHFNFKLPSVEMYVSPTLASQTQSHWMSVIFDPSIWKFAL